MKYIAALLRLLLVVIGIKLIMDNPFLTTGCLTGVWFILTALSLCLNRIMAVKWTTCIISCFNKKK